VASFTLERRIGAPPELVFDVLTDHRAYAEITPVRRARLEREGEPQPNGTGAIRVLSSLGPPLREEVLVYEPPSRFSYTVLSGLPVRDHLGTVALEPVDGGTRLTYAVKMIPTLPLAARFVVAGVRQGVKVLVEGVAGEAERRAAAA
jgi:uncharacterized protein YndB with AHSA1/START domain